MADLSRAFMIESARREIEQLRAQLASLEARLGEEARG